MKKIIISLVIFLIPLNVHGLASTSKSAILYDQDSKRILFAKNIDEKHLIASTTKIMTAVLAVESGKLDYEVTTNESILKSYGSGIYISVNETLTLRDLVYGLLYISTLFLIAGIENQNHTISKPVLFFGFIVNAIYIIYLYIFKLDIYKYAIYLAIFLIIVLIDTIILKKTGKQNYTSSILLLCFYMALATGEEVTILSIITALLMTAISQIVISNKDNKSEIIMKDQKKISIATYLCISNIVFLILQNFILGVNI